jgi:hypothetical protein
MPAPVLEVTTPARLADTLRLALHGQNAPLSAQYAWQMLHLLPRDVAAHPGSREFRQAQRDFWDGRGIALDATRRDIEQGVTFLIRAGATLPALHPDGR